MSGLRCADVLLQHGFNVTIIEGRDRIGGRMHQTATSSGHLVDMGPNVSSSRELPLSPFGNFCRI